MTDRDLLIVDHPTPIAVVSACLQAIGAMYPSAKMRTDTGHVVHVVVEEGAVARDVDWSVLEEEL
jgi:hypothetical protein